MREKPAGAEHQDGGGACGEDDDCQGAGNRKFGREITREAEEEYCKRDDPTGTGAEDLGGRGSCRRPLASLIRCLPEILPQECCAVQGSLLPR
eukprot:646161-Hanusia_phi.AAC.4